MNWLAPCLLKGQTQNIQSALMGTLACDTPGTMGLVLMPTFTYTRGQLWLAENAALKAMTGQNLNVDSLFMVPFKACICSFHHSSTVSYHSPFHVNGPSVASKQLSQLGPCSN
jgi:hypothetical protein